MQPRVLLGGLAMPESPRWHDGRLWFSNWGTREIVAVDVDCQYVRIIGTKECSDLSEQIDDILDVDEGLSDS